MTGKTSWFSAFFNKNGVDEGVVATVEDPMILRMLQARMRKIGWFTMISLVVITAVLVALPDFI
jgi:hypothetical protein